MDGFERVVARQRKQLRTIGIGSIVLGGGVVIGTYFNQDFYDAVGGTLRALLVGGAFVGAGITAIWRSYTKT